MIQNVHIEFENCFGIKQLCQNFKFSSNQRVHLVYAPNGTMKSSFAKTMSFLSGQKKNKPCDILHQDVISKYEVRIDGNIVTKEELFVVDGEEDIDSSKSFVNFLASAELKARYDEIYGKLTAEKNALMSILKGVSHSSNCENEILSTFAVSDNDTIFSVLEKLSSKVRVNVPLYEFKYNDIFDSKGAVKGFLDIHRIQLQKYIDNYNKLLKKSKLFRTVNGHTFGTYHANQLVQYVSDGAFFGVNHKIILQDGRIVNSYEQLKKIISDEQKKVLNNEELKVAFEKITKAIDKNAELRGFKAVIEAHRDWIPEILNYEVFKKKVWVGFFSKPEVKSLFDSYIAVYVENKSALNEILSKANQQQKVWKDIIDLYNVRFHVPIKVAIKNQKDIILKQEAAKLQFFYSDKGQDVQVNDKKQLENILSRGERRAFIILQFLFEMESRKNASNDTLLVMDDIADSFDYQNKYAIIEYIKDLSESSSKNNFYSIILTHNYDFYRTVSSRLELHRKNLWMVERNSKGEITFLPGQYKGNVFENVFVGHDDQDKIFISMIPFVRNLIEYTKGLENSDYLILTSCLHIKGDTKTITEEQLVDVMSPYTVGKGMKRHKKSSLVFDLIMKTARAISQETAINPVLIENKIVLSIAIRLMAEQYLHDKLITAGKTERELSVKGSQMGKWTGDYKSLCPDDANKSIIERVNMMTPELIHLNSFMFEPLIDMSVSHLVQLYNDCANRLNNK